MDMPMTMTPAEMAGVALIALGLFYFLAGSVGLLRFPDAASRLHALTKADSLGLALIAAGAGCLAGAWEVWVKLVLIWVFVALASATGGHLVARHVLRRRRTP
jgi:multicomponent Na+:H+ antiporter subunit G